VRTVRTRLLQAERPEVQSATGPARLVAVATSLLALAFAFQVLLLTVTGRGSERRDFVSYWAAGELFAHHQNPYNADAVLRLERAQGFPSDKQALIMRNPPSALALVAPLGLVGYRTAAMLWSLMLFVCLIGSMWMLWDMHGRPGSRFRVLGYPFGPVFVCLLFGPALVCLFAGQTALFALLGLVLFLRFHRSRPFVAGMSLWLCALKPHLFLPFVAVLLVWIVTKRNYAVVRGAMVALGASSVAAFLIDPACAAQYTAMMHTAGMEREFIPCLGIALRLGVWPHAAWEQYAPAVAGCVWAIRYYWKRRDTWDWMEDGAPVMLVAIFVSPYAWLTDQALALPALLQVALRTNLRSLLLLAFSSVAIDLQIVFMVDMHSKVYLWTAPVWLVWYLIARRRAEDEAGITFSSAAPAPLAAS
jgi:hypothetical protein